MCVDVSAVIPPGRNDRVFLSMRAFLCRHLLWLGACSAGNIVRTRAIGCKCERYNLPLPTPPRLRHVMPVPLRRPQVVGHGAAKAEPLLPRPRNHWRRQQWWRQPRQGSRPLSPRHEGAKHGMLAAAAGRFPRESPLRRLRGSRFSVQPSRYRRNVCPPRRHRHGRDRCGVPRTQGKHGRSPRQPKQQQQREYGQDRHEQDSLPPLLPIFRHRRRCHQQRRAGPERHPEPVHAADGEPATAPAARPPPPRLHGGGGGARGVLVVPLPGLGSAPTAPATPVGARW